MVLKTKPDQSVQQVQSWIGALSSSFLWKNRKLGKIGQKPKTNGLTVKTANWSSWTGFGPVPLIPKLRRFYSFFPNLKAIFFIFSLPSSVLMPFSLSHSASRSLTHFLSLSHLRLLTVSLQARSHLRGSRSRSLTVSPQWLAISPLPQPLTRDPATAHDLVITSHLRSHRHRSSSISLTH